MALSLQSKHNRLMRPGRRTNVWDVFTCCFPHSHDPLEFGGDNDTGYEGSQDLVPHPHPIKLGPSKLIRRASDTSPSKKSGVSRLFLLHHQTTKGQETGDISNGEDSSERL